MVESNTDPASRLNKQNLLFSYHWVREAIAASIIHIIFFSGLINPAYFLSKAWGYKAIWLLLKALLFWAGDMH